MNAIRLRRKHTDGHRGLGMRLARVALAIGCATGLGALPHAGADPEAKPLPPFPECGSQTDTDRIWEGVKGATPQDFKTNVDVVFPPSGDSTRGYALHNGKPGGTANPFDFLLVPTVREKGIECDNLYKKVPPEYFNDAYKYVASAPKGLPKNTDWALGIESADPGARSFNQLHIHVSRIRASTRTSLDKVSKSCGANESEWRQKKIVVNTNNGDRTFRCWNASVMTHNFFGKLHDNVAQPLNIAMSHETLFITTNKGPGGGFLVLNSDHEGADLNKNGVNNIESLLDKG